MDKNVIEKFATNAVKDRMLKTGCMDPNISEGDKEPSWDGTIYLYKPGCTFSKSNLEGRISVQVKGHACENLSKDQITFDTDIADLKNYSMDGGVLYFVVYVAQSGATQVYYAELTPARLAGLLDQCTPGQKTKRIELDILPEDQDAVARIAREFRERCIRSDGKRAKFDLPLVSALTAGSFVGRERELAQIEAELENGSNPIFLSGLGGMGKTELAVKFGKNYQASGRGNVYMITFQDSFYKTLMQTIAPQIPGLLEGNKDEKLIYDTVIHHLKQWGRDDILIIDNADEDSGNFAKLQDDAFQDLKALPCRMIITTRCNVRLAVKAEPLEREQLRSLFDLYDVDISLEDRDALIDSVHSHTMTVDMIAQTLADSNFLSAEQVLRAMRTGVMDEDFEAIGVYHNQDPEQRRIDGHLLNLFRVADLDEDAQKVLSCAILLPQGGMDVDTFRKALPDGLSTALKAQEKRGWLKFDHAARTLTIHPVIRLVCRTGLKNWKEICPEFLTRLHEKFEEKNYTQGIYGQIAQVYLSAAAEVPEETAMWHFRAGWYLLQQGQFKEALECELHTLKVRETTLGADDLLIADSCNDLGIVYGYLGQYENALEVFQRAYDIRRDKLTDKHRKTAHSCNNVGEAYHDMGYYDQALEYKKAAMVIFEEILQPDDPDLATSYNNVGITYGARGNPQKALEYKEKALEIREKALPENHPDLANSYSNVGITYGDLGNHQKALEYAEKALEIREKVLPKNHPDLANSYNNVGSAYGNLGDHQKALEYLEKALEIRKQSLPANHPNIASSLYSIAVTHCNLAMRMKPGFFQKKKLQTALQNVREALQVVRSSPSGWHPKIKDMKQLEKDLKRLAK